MGTQRHHLRIALVVIAVTGVAFAAAVSASAGSACHQPPTEDSTTTVELRFLCFSPTVARVEVGSTVEFLNSDGFAHNVVGHGVSWGGVADIAPGDSLVARFDTPGVHPFSCTLHPGMVGAIVVGDVTGQAATPTRWSGLGTAAATAIVVVGAAALWYLPNRPSSDEPPPGPRYESTTQNPRRQPEA